MRAEAALGAPAAAQVHMVARPLSPRQVVLAAMAGAAAVTFLVTQWRIWVYTEGPQWILPVLVVAYVIGLVVWAGSWRRPFEALGALFAAVTGFFVGYVVAIWFANMVSLGPDV
jgi:hypothetical protein